MFLERLATDMNMAAHVAGAANCKLPLHLAGMLMLACTESEAAIYLFIFSNTSCAVFGQNGGAKGSLRPSI